MGAKMGHIPTLYIARTADGNGLPLPSYSSEYHVGLNLQAAIPSAVRLEPGDRAYMSCGFAIGVPQGYVGMVVSQPLLAKDQGLIVLDGPQILHPADRTPLFMLLQNMSSHQIVVHRGDVVAQLVIMPAVQVAWQDVSNADLVSDSVTNSSKVVIDSAGKKGESNKMVSARRVYKDARHRFSEDEGTDDNEN